MQFAEERDGAESGADAIERRFVARSPMLLPLQSGQSESGGTG